MEPNLNWVHPELREGEILLLNVKDTEEWGVPPFCESVRRGEVAYATYGAYIVPDMKPLFGKLKTSYAHPLPDIIRRYNNLLNERASLKDVTIIYPYRSHLRGRYRGDSFHRRRITQLRRQVERNIKRIENVIEKLWYKE